MRAAMIHLIGDLIQSFGVLIAAIIIKFYPHLKIIDPVCTFVFSILVMFTTWNVVRDCIRVLMEATPVGINLDQFEQ
jgi:zinc transporter 2